MANTHSKDAVAEKLASAHYAIEHAISRIFRLEAPGGKESDPSEPIKLLEVNENTTADGIVPVPMTADASNGIYYPSVVIEVTPEEFKQIESGELALPHGWERRSEYPRPLIATERQR